MDTTTKNKPSSANLQLDNGERLIGYMHLLHYYALKRSVIGIARTLRPMLDILQLDYPYRNSEIWQFTGHKGVRTAAGELLHLVRSVAVELTRVQRTYDNEKLVMRTMSSVVAFLEKKSSGKTNAEIKRRSTGLSRRQVDDLMVMLDRVGVNTRNDNPLMACTLLVRLLRVLDLDFPYDSVVLRWVAHYGKPHTVLNAVLESVDGASRKLVEVAEQNGCTEPVAQILDEFMACLTKKATSL